MRSSVLIVLCALLPGCPAGKAATRISRDASIARDGTVVSQPDAAQSADASADALVVEYTDAQVEESDAFAPSMDATIADARVDGALAFDAALPDARLDAPLDASLDARADAAPRLDAAIDAPVSGSGDRCESAIIAGAGSYSGSTASAATDYTLRTDTTAFPGCKRAEGPDRVYRITVPAGQRASVTATPTSFDLVLNVVSANVACSSATTCLASADIGISGGVERVDYSNAGSSAQDIFVIVTGYQSTSSGSYTLNVAIEPISTGETCSTPTVITTTGLFYSQAIYTFGNDYTGTSNGCKFGVGPDRVYRVSVPANNQLRAGVVPTGFDPMISFVLSSDTCSGTSQACAGGRDDLASGGTETASYFNSSGSTQNVLVVIDSYGTAASDASFTFGVDVAPPLAGDICEAAIAIGTSETVTGSLNGFFNDYTSGTGCSGVSGPDRVYSVSIPAGRTLAASVQPNGSSALDPSVNIVAGPATSCGVTPRVCLASDDSGGASTVNTARYTNSGMSAVTVFIAVETYSSTPSGEFRLTTALE